MDTFKPAFIPQTQHHTAHSLSIPGLSDPRLMGELPSTDPLSTLLNKHLPAHLRPPRHLSGSWSIESTFNVDSPALSEAISTNSWRRVATLAKSSITSEKGVTEVLGWWSVRLYALCRLRLYSLMRTELVGLSSLLDGLHESVLLLVPFSLRVLRAREPRYRGDFRSAIEAIVELLGYCKRQIRTWSKAAKKGQNQAGELEEVQIQKAIWTDRATRLGIMVASMLAEVKDFASAIALLDPLVAKAKSGKSSTLLLSLVARMYLQAGSIASATELLDQAAKLHQGDDDDDSTALLLAKNEALLLAIKGDYPAAETTLRECAEKGDEAVSNDLAISIFYQGRLQEPVDMLETMLSISPSSVTNVEPFIFNLCTLHELRSDDSMSDKRRILALVGQWAGEGCGTSCLKLG